jgi:hypothetical protein
VRVHAKHCARDPATLEANLESQKLRRKTKPCTRGTRYDSKQNRYWPNHRSRKNRLTLSGLQKNPGDPLRCVYSLSCGRVKESWICCVVI